MSNTTERLSYKVKDISLADWGRKEIKLAEAEMPGLMSLEKSTVPQNHWQVQELQAACT